MRLDPLAAGLGTGAAADWAEAGFGVCSHASLSGNRVPTAPASNKETASA